MLATPRRAHRSLSVEPGTIVPITGTRTSKQKPGQQGVGQGGKEANRTAKVQRLNAKSPASAGDFVFSTQKPAMSSPAWIALSIAAAISRTLVEDTWLKILRYQCTMGSLKNWPPPVQPDSGARPNNLGERFFTSSTGPRFHATDTATGVHVGHDNQSHHPAYCRRNRGSATVVSGKSEKRHRSVRTPQPYDLPTEPFS
jgi:hypothetical protein